MTQNKPRPFDNSLPDNPPTINDVVGFRASDSFRTKSQGELQVLFALPLEVAQKYFEYDSDELARIDGDIRGLRVYRIDGLDIWNRGGLEYHRIRKEILFGLAGEVNLELEDLPGDRRDMLLTPRRGVYIPPFVLHTYEAVQNSSALLTVANTLFDPHDPGTHDTFSIEMFRALQIQYRQSESKGA